jgi:methyl-accepting chemotaxis protein
MNISISKRVGLITGIVLISTIGIMQFVLLSREENARMAKVNKTVGEVSTVIMESIKFSMGEGTSEISPFLERAKKMENIRDLRLIPTNNIIANSEDSMDSREREVIGSRIAQRYSEQFKGEDVYRSIEPLLAEAKCISCHQANEKDPLAVISIRYSIKSDKASIAETRIYSVCLSIGAIMIAILALFFFLKKEVIRDLITSVNDIKKLSTGDITSTSEINRKDELGTLADSIRIMRKALQGHSEIALQISEGNVNAEVIILSEKDVLGKSMLTMKNSLSKLVADVNKLHDAAINGNLNIRTNPSNHKGEYKNIIEAFNLTLDSISSPVEESADVLRAMADKNLTKRMTGKYCGDFDKLKNSINSVADAMNKVLIQISDSVHATVNASIEISASTEELAAGAQEQSMQTKESADAVMQMAKTIMDTTKNASNASEASKLAGEIAVSGGKDVQDTTDGMERIVEVVEKSAITIQKLGNRSNEIGEIIQVIDDIADQTNLLALNAAIEAARAGEQGRGFAVVADEVRKLAERTAKATKEIAQMIKLIQNETDIAVNVMGEGKSEVEKGKLLASKSGTSLKEIIEKIKVVTDMITQVAAASEEQSATSEQISKSIETISNVTQQNTEGTQQIARATENLSSLAQNLEQLVSQFQLNDVKDNKYIGLMTAN